MLGDFSSANGDLRLLNVTAGIGGKSYMSFNKVPSRLAQLCDNLNEVRHNAKSLAEAIGITAKGVEKQLAKLKAQGVIRRIGPDKGGIWEVVGPK